MDDLYQNAWSETTDPADAFKGSSTPSWSTSATKPSSSYHEEADLAAPSWSTGADIRWDEPPGSPGFSWSHADADAGWGHSTYEGISFSKASIDIEKETSTTLNKDPDVDSEDVADSPSAQSSTPSSPSSLPPRVPSPSLPPLPSSPPSIPDVDLSQTYELAADAVRLPSPDGFGSFESALVEDTVPSPGFAVADAEADPWGSSAWAGTGDEASDEENERIVDEWERAKQEKARQDRHVPPELLASILHQCEELARDIGPSPAVEDQVSEKDTWRNDRRSGIEGVPGLDTLLETFLPPLTLQPPVRFSQALIAKRMATSVKLTKNISLARSSPMSHYLAAKGSTAWETSVKERKDTVEDDVPVGWRIIEKATPATVQGAKEKKASGGLFSFWGRRQSQQAQVSNEAQGNSRASSLDKPQSPALEEANGGSRRPSQDSLRSLANSREVQLPSPSSEPSSSQTIPDPPTVMSSYATASDPVPERSSTPPAPSAVSRFLNKFSRRSSVGGSPRSSLALSSDDIEFLSDTVPSAADDADDGTTDALEKFVSAKRESVVLALPPPLAPPPRASPTLRPSSTVHNPHSTGSKAGSPTSDLEALFGSLGSWNAPTTSSVLSATGPSQTVIPPLAPPLVPSRSATPAGASGSGLSKPTAIMSSGALTSSRPPSRLQTSTPPLAGFALPPPPSFEPITSIKPSKPKLASPFPLPQGSASPAEPGPMSASSTSSYATAAESSSRSSPPSPTSSLPLGELYPHLVTPTTPPQPSAQAFFPSGMPRGFHTMSSATSTTPLASIFPSSPAPPLLRPQMQSTNAISPTAAPLKSDFFDEDFSDFQSPVMEHLSDPSPSAPSPIAKSPQTLTAARAANASRAAPVRSQTVPNSTHIAFPQPPLPAKSYKPPSMPPLQTLASFDDDDFADFQTSPRSPQNMQPPSSSTLFSNSMSDKALLTPKNSMSFSGFNDLIGGGSLATPSPPRVPAKPIPPLRPPSVPSLQPPPVPALQPHPAVPPAFQPLPTPAPSPSMSASTLPSASSSSSLLARRESKKRSHAADHLHTLNLMEKAAAKSGQRWPAPLSPLPAIIPGPSGATGKGAYFDIMDEDAPTPATQPVPALVPSSSSPAALNPAGRPSGMGVGNTNGVPANGMSFMALNPTTSSSNGSLSNSLLQGWDSSFSSFQGASSPPKASSPGPPFVAPGMPANGKVVQGGLSAQDLLFFEGL